MQCIARPWSRSRCSRAKSHQISWHYILTSHISRVPPRSHIRVFFLLSHTARRSCRFSLLARISPTPLHWHCLASGVGSTRRLLSSRHIFCCSHTSTSQSTGNHANVQQLTDPALQAGHQVATYSRARADEHEYLCPSNATQSVRSRVYVWEGKGREPGAGGVKSALFTGAVPLASLLCKER